MQGLGRLEKVKLRATWLHEAHDFTRWLAAEPNLRLLSDELDLEMVLLQAEASVGKFNVDILAEEAASGKKIVIENQLETTNHDHLGKIITYASGVDASFVVWIVADVREEHKRAIDWLNEHTDESISFFLIRLELWRIDNSPPAPKFNIVSQPNDWAKVVKQSSASGANPTATKLRQLEFWEKFKEYAQAQKTKLRLRKAFPQHWYSMSAGASNWHIALTLNSPEKKMGCEVYIQEDKELFRIFESHKDKVEEHLGSDIEWMELPDKKASRIKQSASCNLEDEARWPEYFAWLLYRAESFHKTFGELKTAKN